jgi:hypothetical protein
VQVESEVFYWNALAPRFTVDADDDTASDPADDMGQTRDHWGEYGHSAVWIHDGIDAPAEVAAMGGLDSDFAGRHPRAGGDGVKRFVAAIATCSPAFTLRPNSLRHTNEGSSAVGPRPPSLMPHAKGSGVHG